MSGIYLIIFVWRPTWPQRTNQASPSRLMFTSINEKAPRVIRSIEMYEGIALQLIVWSKYNKPPAKLWFESALLRSLRFRWNTFTRRRYRSALNYNWPERGVCQLKENFVRFFVRSVNQQTEVSLSTTQQNICPKLSFFSYTSQLGYKLKSRSRHVRTFAVEHLKILQNTWEEVGRYDECHFSWFGDGIKQRCLILRTDRPEEINQLQRVETSKIFWGAVVEKRITAAQFFGKTSFTGLSYKNHSSNIYLFQTRQLITDLFFQQDEVAPRYAHSFWQCVHIQLGSRRIGRSSTLLWPIYHMSLKLCYLLFWAYIKIECSIPLPSSLRYWGQKNRLLLLLLSNTPVER